MVSRDIPVKSFNLVIFGGTGDLAHRKILPGLFLRYLSGQMPEDAHLAENGISADELDVPGAGIMPLSIHDPDGNHIRIDFMIS